MTVITVRHAPDPAAAALLARIHATTARMAPDVVVEARPESEWAGSRVEIDGYGVGGAAAPPADWLLEAALLRALRPRHVLFMCVANSARSQMAEGLARALAPASVRVSSAGSEPSVVRPQAVTVMREVGVDIGGQWSKGADEVERPVDTVITLCAEEVCPIWLAPARRVHWGLPDPAGAGDDPEEELAAFRSVRDELHRRLRVVFMDRA